MKEIIRAITHSEDADGAMCAILFGFIDVEGKKMGDIYFSTASSKNDTIMSTFSNWVDSIMLVEDDEEIQDTFIITDLDVDRSLTAPMLQRIEYEVEAAIEHDRTPKHFKIIVVDHHQSSRQLRANLTEDEKKYLEIVTPDSFDGFESADKQAACSTLLKYLVNEGYIHPVDVSKNLESMVNHVSRYDTFEWKNHPSGENAFGSNYPMEVYYHTLFGLIGLETFVTQFSKILHEDLNLAPDHFVSIVLRDYNEMESYMELKGSQLKKSRFGEYNIGIIVVDGYHRYFSISGNHICDENPDIDFLIALYPAISEFSLRSTKNDLNCARIAKFLGEGNGGGHPKAAGGKLSQKRMFDFMNSYYYEEASEEDMM